MTSTAVALLRLACGLTLEAVSALAGRSTTWVRARLAEHDRRTASHPGYAGGVAGVLSRARREEAGRLGDLRVIPIVSPAEVAPSDPAAFPRAGVFRWQSAAGRG